MTALDPQPTITLATLRVEYSDGSAVIVAVPQAELCEVADVPARTPPGAEHWLDATRYRMSEPLPPLAGPVDLRIVLHRVPVWRLAVRKPGEAWRDDTREWLANGTPRSEL